MSGNLGPSARTSFCLLLVASDLSSCNRKIAPCFRPSQTEIVANPGTDRQPRATAESIFLASWRAALLQLHQSCWSRLGLVGTCLAWPDAAVKVASCCSCSYVSSPQVFGWCACTGRSLLSPEQAAAGIVLLFGGSSHRAFRYVLSQNELHRSRMTAEINHNCCITQLRSVPALRLSNGNVPS